MLILKYKTNTKEKEKKMKSPKNLMVVYIRTTILLQNTKQNLLNIKKGIKGALLMVEYEIYARDG